MSSSSTTSTTNSGTTAVVLPLSVTCPSIETWNGSLRAQIILRCYARWCLCLPLRIPTHINVVVLDALIDAKGFISSARLTQQLGLAHWSQVYELLMHGACSFLVTSRAPSFLQMMLNQASSSTNSSTNNKNLSPEEEQRFKNLREQMLLKMHQEQSSNKNGGEGSSSSQPQFAISNAHVEFAIDYRKAIPFAFLNICVYFMNLFCESKETSQLADSAARNQILHSRARLIKCINCSKENVWSENEAPVLTCSQCMSNMTLGILEGLVNFTSTTTSTNSTINSSSSHLHHHHHHHIGSSKNLHEVILRLQQQGCFNAVCEQAALFLKLFKTKFVLLARAGAVVTHPDRVFAEEEFSSLMELSGNNNNSSTTTTFGLQNCRGIVLGVSRPQFVEPPGVMENWLPGLRIQNLIKKNKLHTNTSMTKKQQQSAGSFPPWLRDEGDDDNVDGLNNKNKNSNIDPDESSSSEDEDDLTSPADKQRNKDIKSKKRNKRKVTFNSEKMASSSDSNKPTTRWPAVYQHEKEDKGEMFHRHHDAKRRQRQDDDDDDEWETVIG